MPLSNDNQDFGKSDEKNKQNQEKPSESQTQMTSDDLKGKQQVDADIEKEQDRPADQQK